MVKQTESLSVYQKKVLFWGKDKTRSSKFERFQNDDSMPPLMLRVACFLSVGRRWNVVLSSDIPSSPRLEQVGVCGHGSGIDLWSGL